MKYLRALLSLAVVASVLVLSGCGADSGTATTPPATPSADDEAATDLDVEVEVDDTETESDDSTTE